LSSFISKAACALVALCVAAGSVVAQSSRAAVAGRVVDESGAAVAGALVTVRRETVGFETTALTDASGGFTFEGLVAATYDVSASADGFSAATAEVALAGGESRTVDLALRPGAFAEEVSVYATTIVGTPESVRRIPGSVDVVDEKTLETSRVFNFTEALRKVSGINVRDEEGFGLRPNIGIRGLSPTRSTKVLLLEDGIPFTYAPYGDNASYYHPPVERFERIEVLKGSGQIAYGPTTVGGVINYITPSPPSDFSGKVTVSGGSRDYFNGEIEIGDTWGETGVLLTAMRKQGEGARENMRFGLWDVNLKVVQTISSNQTLTLKANYYGEDSQVPYSGLREDEYEADPRQNPFLNDGFFADRVGLSAIHAYQFDNDAILTTSVYGSYFKRHWWRQSSNSNERPNDASDPRCGGMANLLTDCGNQGRLRRYFFWGVEPRLTFAWDAGETRNETEVGFRVHFEDQNRIQKNGDFPTARDGVVVEDNERNNAALSGFLQNRFLLGRWTVTPGLRFEYMRLDRTNNLLDVSGDAEIAQLVPGVGVSYSLAESTTAFAGVHRGFAPPRTEDLVNNTTGGTIDLDPELSWNYEAGIRSLIVPGVRVDSTFFRMDYENQIVPASVAGGLGATFTNGGETLHQGVEATGRVDFGTVVDSPHNVYVRTSYTWLPIAEFRGNRFSSIPTFTDVSVRGNRLPYAPEHLLNFTVGYSHPWGVDALVEAVRVSEQFADDLNTIESSADGQRGLVPSYTIWNATLNVRPGQMPTTFFVSVKNLANELYIADRSRGLIPGPPRLVHAGLQYQF
jgi:Fe(3+) dicitrate transport protein